METLPLPRQTASFTLAGAPVLTTEAPRVRYHGGSRVVPTHESSCAVAATAGSGGVGVAACAPGHRSQAGPHAGPFMRHVPHLRAPLGRPRDPSLSTDSGG